jgi:hypothetical protein
MATETKSKAGAGRKKRQRKSSAKGQKRGRKEATLVKMVMESIEEKLRANELKPTVGDFIRLLQLEKELGEEQPKEIKVSWIEPSEKEHASDT